MHFFIRMESTENRQLSGASAPAWQARLSPHPAAAILLWVFLAIALQALHPAWLAAAGACLLAAALALSRRRFFTLLRRIRWIMLSLLIIYGYFTPGAALWGQLGALSPSREGIVGGVVMLARLVFALAGLALLLGMLTRAQLMGGIYALASPLRLLGLSAERIAVRLALTLHYAESAMQEKLSGWRAGLARIDAPAAGGAEQVELHFPPFRLRDGLLLAAAGLLLVLALW